MAYDDSDDEMIEDTMGIAMELVKDVVTPDWNVTVIVESPGTGGICIVRSNAGDIPGHLRTVAQSIEETDGETNGGADEVPEPARSN